ncbi:hypothetical protein [Planktothrix mougeotii]|uniref:Uncharacterized protein n=1 Tax=Planktothrix mougeotii LEGE 06226 TaxID=1828728 RepID=A0ABR9U5H5_9CYAN|nr:hypothetical protein [Planktothrix mougeotii]MBE9141695.1 hypothetical protein [Planktothrix mougeotii LEGE 06226]
MTKMTIADLSFCENTGTNAQEIKGGDYFSVPSTSVSTDHSSSHNAFYIIQRSDDSYWIYASYSSSVSGAVAGAISDGITSTYAYASTYAS